MQQWKTIRWADSIFVCTILIPNLRGNHVQTECNNAIEKCKTVTHLFSNTGCNHLLKWWNCTNFTFITFICISFSNFVLSFFLVWLLRISVYPFSFFSTFFVFPVTVSDNICCLVKDDVMLHAAQRIRLKAKYWIIFVVSRNCYLVIGQQTRTSLSFTLWQRVTVNYQFFKSSDVRCCVLCKIK